MKNNILVVDDEIRICTSIERTFKQEGYNILTIQNGKDALNILHNNNIQLVLTDLTMPEMNGIEFLKQIKKINNNIPVIMMTANATIETAIEAMKLGAIDYISKPFSDDELIIRVRNAINNSNLNRENRLLKSELEKKYGFENIIGKSKKMEEVYRVIEKIAPTDCTVLIQGESGTGKELIARAVHYNSLRKERPFIYLDCGSLVETLLESELFGHVKGSFTGADNAKQGLFEAADTGTIFLDEIGNMSSQLQAKLLRVLQEKEIKPVGSTKIVKVNVRLITATNENLEELINKKQFRKDLFYRLNVVPINLPTLQEREGDIPVLINYFLKKYSKNNPKNITLGAMNLLESYDWPGNVRELENIIERAVVMSDENTILPVHLPHNIQNTNNKTIKFKIPKTSEELKKVKKQLREEAVIDVEKSFFEESVKRNNGNITKAADEVGMDRGNFHALIRKYNITLS